SLPPHVPQEPIIVSGPEILNSFVGKSEEAVRKLFEPAEQEQREKGDKSALHLIIFDEIDAICRKRASVGGGAGGHVNDTVVNQLLAKLDGVDQLNNILEPIIVSGPEILNSFVGKSEEAVRKLFEPAEQEQREKGDKSALHLIIFDEIDAICRKRASVGGGAGGHVNDTVVNQLLAKLDGVDQLNNIL
ncbi:MAG: hypothetical protein MHM6MM_009514, partial [Cercozoa sp. M6MM]